MYGHINIAEKSAHAPVKCVMSVLAPAVMTNDYNAVKHLTKIKAVLCFRLCWEQMGS